MKLVTRLLLGTFLILVAWIVAGCKSPESAENESSRPWNAPRQWETGLPGFSPEHR